jgi:hypothetical protein
MTGRTTLGLAWIVLGLGTAACYPDRAVDSNSEFATVTTLYDKTAPFQNVTKYAMPDTVLYVPKDSAEVPAATQNAVLSAIRTQLNLLGWQEVVNPSATNPVDVYVVSSITKTKNVFIGYGGWWDYWGWYPYWPPGWGGGYGWYYPGYWYAYSYETGTLLMQMINAHGTVGDNKVPIIWAGSVNAVFENPSTNISVATAGIQQAFRQSPYLKEGVQ